jgi:hypothetical protein
MEPGLQTGDFYFSRKGEYYFSSDTLGVGLLFMKTSFKPAMSEISRLAAIKIASQEPVILAELAQLTPVFGLDIHDHSEPLKYALAEKVPAASQWILSPVPSLSL